MAIRFPSRSMVNGLPELSIGGWPVALEPASALARLHRQQQRPAAVLRCPGHLLDQDVVTAKLVHLDATKSGAVDQVQVIRHRMSKRSEAILDAIPLEVRLDARRGHLGMEHREDEPPSSNEAVTELAEHEARIAEELSDSA